MCRGDPSHQRSLLTVPVAAGSEDDDQLPGAELARGPEHVVERVRRVGVVDDDAERLPCLHGLEPAGNAGDRLEPAPHSIGVDPEGPCGGDRAGRVLAIEAAAQPKVGAEVIRSGEGDRLRQLGGQTPPPLVPDVDYRDVRLVEQRALRGEVRIHRAVEVEVVLGQVREDEHAEARAGKTPLRAADRRRLDRSTSDRRQRASRGTGAAGRSPRAY